MLLQTVTNGSSLPNTYCMKNEKKNDTNIRTLNYAPAPGWTTHVTSEGRLYYCNHFTRCASWLPPIDAWKCNEDNLPYGWEQAVDDAGRSYYINHLNKTTTYETPMISYENGITNFEPRSVALEKSSILGFGFVAGSEQPVVVKFVTDGGPSVNKLWPGDQILAINGKDVKMAPREEVIALVRSCTTDIHLIVCQPYHQKGVRKSTILSESKKALLRSRQSRVKFAESICVNGAPLFPPSAFSLSDLCVAPMANVLKVFLENGSTKSFKYDSWTTVKDVIDSLEDKLSLTATEHFSLVIEHIKSSKRNKLTILEPNDTLTKVASRPGTNKIRCLFRVSFMPISVASLAEKDINAFNYFFAQCCNDVIQERFAPELQYEIALKLAALQMYHHALINNIKFNKQTLKIIERELGLERFIPCSILDHSKTKEIRKFLIKFLKLQAVKVDSDKYLSTLQIKLHYLEIISQLPSYGAKCFSIRLHDTGLEKIILVSPKWGISEISHENNNVPVVVSSIEDIKQIEIRNSSEWSKIILIHLYTEEIMVFVMEECDGNELVLVLSGYYYLLTGQHLNLEKDFSPLSEANAPPYLAQHRVIPDKWSYLEQNNMKIANFTILPEYQAANKKTTGLYNTVGRQFKSPLSIRFNLDNVVTNPILKKHESNVESDYDIQSLISMEILENSGADDSKDETVLRRVEEMHQLVANAEKYLINEKEDKNPNCNKIERNDSYSQLKHSDSLTLFSKRYKDLAKTIFENYSSHENNGLKDPENDIHDINENNVFLDIDIIDLTLLPPPVTPDELDNKLPTALNIPPARFADSLQNLTDIDDFNSTIDSIEDFLTTVFVPLPNQKSTPTIELTNEELLPYIIPPPPKLEEYSTPEMQKDSNESMFFNSASIELPPRRTVNDKPPKRPPKIGIKLQNQISHVVTVNSTIQSNVPPQIPPRNENVSPSYLSLPPKKKSISVSDTILELDDKEEVRNMQNTKSNVHRNNTNITKTSSEDNLYQHQNRIFAYSGTKLYSNELSLSLEDLDNICETSLSEHVIRNMEAKKLLDDSNLTEEINEVNCVKEKEGIQIFTKLMYTCKYTLNNEFPITKAYVAMVTLLKRLEHSAHKCNIAEHHGGGEMICEEKFQAAKEELTSQSLKLIHSSQILITSMIHLNLTDVPSNLGNCFTILQRLTELCEDLARYSTAPLQTKNLIIKVHEVVSGFWYLISFNINKKCEKSTQVDLMSHAEGVANRLSTLLRSLRVFAP